MVVNILPNLLQILDFPSDSANNGVHLKKIFFR